MPNFHETGYGRKFFGKQLPDLIKSINRVADILEEKNTEVKTKEQSHICINCGENSKSPNVYEDALGEFMICSNCGTNLDKNINDLLNKNIYTISGADVASVLKDMNRDDVIEDKEMFKSLLVYLVYKLDIPWADYLESAIQLKLDVDEKLD